MDNKEIRELIARVIPEGHSGGCINDNLYSEPEDICFSECDRCRATKAVSLLLDVKVAADNIDRLSVPNHPWELIEKLRRQIKRVEDA